MCTPSNCRNTINLIMVAFSYAIIPMINWILTMQSQNKGKTQCGPLKKVSKHHIRAGFKESTVLFYLFLDSLQFSQSVMFNSLRPHGPQHARPPCPSPTPGVYSNSCPLSVMLSNCLILYHPFLFPSSIFPSIRVFYNESALHIRWPKYWNFSFNISPSNEHSGLISFRMD